MAYPNKKSRPSSMVPGGESEWELSKFPDFPKVIDGNYNLIGKKQGGQNSTNEYGGVYELKNINANTNTNIVLFKQGRNDGETICEYLASQLYELIIAGYAAKVFMAKFKYNSDTFSINLNKKIHPEIYIGTIFLKNLQK
jgi:hypothetical protein